MTALTRSQATSAADSIRDAVLDDSVTPTILGQFLHNLIDSAVFIGEAETPPTAGNGLTGTNIFAVLADGTTLTVGISGVKISDIAGNSLLGRAAASSGAVAAIAGTDGQVARVSGATLGFGTIATAGIGASQVTLAKLADGTACSMLGRSANSSGVYADVSAGTNGFVFLRRTNACTAALLLNENIDPAAAVSNSKLSFDTAGVTWQSTVASPALSQADETANSATADTLTIQAQNATGTTAIGGGLTLASGTGTSRAGNLALKVGAGSVFQANAATDPGTPGETIIDTTLNNIRFRTNGSLRASMSSATFFLNVAGLTFVDTTASPIIGQQATSGATGTPMVLKAQESTAVAGTGAAFTIQAGDATGASGTRTGGALTIRPGSGATAGGELALCNGAATKRIRIDSTGLAFYNVAPVAQPTDMGALTDSTGGTANGTLVDVGAVFTQATLNDNFADLAAKVTAIRNALRTLGLMA